MEARRDEGGSGFPEPDPNRLIDYLEGRLSAEEAAMVEERVAASGLWRSELAMARSFVEASDERPPHEVRERARRAAVDPKVVPFRSRRQVWRTGLLAAAAAALVFLGGRELWLDRGPAGTEDTIRSYGSGEALPVAVERDATGWRFRWSAPPRTSRARLVVTDVAGRVVLETEPDPEDPRLAYDRLPDSTGPWVARLVAVGADGSEISGRLVELP